MQLSTKKLAKKIAKILRHEPERIDVHLNDDGWAYLHDLVSGFGRMSPYIVTYDDILEAVTDGSRGRFEYDKDEDRVRALKGHTTSEVSYKVAEPPSDGFYRVVSSRHRHDIMEYGIQPMRRRYTQLFETYPEALKDGKRRRIKNPCMLFVESDMAYHDGTLFYCHDGEWYVEEVDAVHLSVEDCEYPESD